MTAYGVMLDAIYGSAEAVDATITLDDTDGTEIEVRALYMPGGAELGEQSRTGSVKMSASVRRAELTTNGITDLADIHKATLTINSETWTIRNWIPFPGPDGEATGETRLVLVS